jgi:hypothetical protein
VVAAANAGSLAAAVVVIAAATAAVRAGVLRAALRRAEAFLYRVMPLETEATWLVIIKCS